jgi:hypothetical protein
MYICICISVCICICMYVLNYTHTRIHTHRSGASGITRGLPLESSRGSTACTPIMARTSRSCFLKSCLRSSFSRSFSHSLTHSFSLFLSLSHTLSPPHVSLARSLSLLRARARALCLSGCLSVLSVSSSLPLSVLSLFLCIYCP